MKITDVKTFLVDASPPDGWNGGGRSWLFVKVETDAGITGLGEASGWPRVVQTAIQDLTPLLVGEDPGRIEYLWQKMLLAMMGHGMTGVVGGGAMTGIEIALWDILGKKLNTPVCDLLGGRIRDRVRVYAHANTPERAHELLERGYTSFKCGSVRQPVQRVKELRSALGDEIDLCIDVHGPPWFSVPDAIRVGQALEEYELLFYEEPVPPENVQSLAKVARSVDVPIACGERSSTLFGFRELIERDIVDVIQPDTGRAGGLMQMKKIAAQAEAHHIMVAPHDGSLGPVAEVAAVHITATLPNFLILEHLADDVSWRYELVDPLPLQDSHFIVPNKPGLGIELNEEVARAHPGGSNVNRTGVQVRTYVESRLSRRRLIHP